LASQIESGSITSQKSLSQPFAQAEFALALFRSEKATETWGKEKPRPRVTGYYLRGAANSLEHAAKWGGHEFEYGAKASLDAARLVSGKLIQGSGFATEEVGKAIKSIGAEVDSLGKVIPPAKPGHAEPAEPETTAPEKT
jgi:hypothetical protein